MKLTAFALFIALCNASRLLLQAPQAPPAPQTPQTQQQWNPYYNMGFNTGYEMGYAAGFRMGYDIAVQPPQQQQPPVTQTQPQPPQTQPAPPVQPPPANNINPPQTIPITQPANPLPPANNQAPPATGPGVGVGVGPQGPQLTPVQPAIPPPLFTPTTTAPPPVTDINCGPFPPATLCANRRSGLGGSPLGPLVLDNLADNAKLYCDTPGACANSEINIDLRPNPAVIGGVTAINQLLFSEAGSGRGSTVNIKNLQNNGNNVELSSLECGTQACGDLTINGWGVSLGDVGCAAITDCMNCKFNNFKTIPDPFCLDPYAPEAVNNPGCIIETKPCYGY